MTEFNLRLGTAPDLMRWRCALLDIEVECTRAVLEMLRRRTEDVHSRAAQVPQETLGILFGDWSESTIRIITARPLACEHKVGPLEYAYEDEAQLVEALTVAREDPELRALKPIGLYLSNSQNFSVAVADIRVFNRYFRRMRHQGLILRTSEVGQTSAIFFVRERGTMTYLDADEVLSSTPEPPHVQQSIDDIPQTDNGLASQPLARKRSALAQHHRRITLLPLGAENRCGDMLRPR